MIIKFEDIEKDMKPEHKSILISIVQQFTKDNIKQYDDHISTEKPYNRFFIFNKKYFLYKKWVLNFILNDGKWGIIDSFRTYKLPNDLFILKKEKKKTLVIKNKEITKELIKLGYKYLYMRDGRKSGIYATTDEPIVIDDHFNASNSDDVLLISPFVSNPHNLKWDASLTELENLL